MNPYIKLLSDETGKVHTIELNYKYFSFNYLLNHLKKMPEFELVKKDKWVLTDDYWVTFIYKEYEFNVSIDLSTSKKLLSIANTQAITSFSEYLAVPLRWGEVVPLYFLDMVVDYVFISHPLKRNTQPTAMIPELKLLWEYQHFQ